MSVSSTQERGRLADRQALWWSRVESTGNSRCRPLGTEMLVARYSCYASRVSRRFCAVRCGELLGEDGGEDGVGCKDGAGRRTEGW